MVMTTATRGVVGVGYEGQDLDSFLAGLTAAGVGVLVDVRLTPISRKRGFSKRALAEAVSNAGMEYRHLPVLGNPKPNRGGFAGTAAELAAARGRYSRLLADPVATAALDELAQLAGQQVVAIMCFEADEQRCHRQVVLAQLQRRGDRPPARV
jgi:uncharacterized protein (DUF488 family)